MYPSGVFLLSFSHALFQNPLYWYSLTFDFFFFLKKSPHPSSRSCHRCDSRRHARAARDPISRMPSHPKHPSDYLGLWQRWRCRRLPSFQVGWSPSSGKGSIRIRNFLSGTSALHRFRVCYHEYQIYRRRCSAKVPVEYAWGWGTTFWEPLSYAPSTGGTKNPASEEEVRWIEQNLSG